jgi:hypothetical protein
VKVACIKWGEKYGAEYVSRLKSMVARNLSCAHEFVCYTDRSISGITCEPLPSDLPGWWAKIGMFRPGFSTGEILYLDLDVVITDDLSVFRRPDDGKVWALDDFSYGFRKPKDGLDGGMKRLLGGTSTCNSSVMFWHRDAGRKVWDDFTPSVMDELHGDQNWVSKVLWPQTLELYPPGLACSYKYHTLRDDGHGAITVFHGDPKPGTLSSRNPLRQMWEAA